MVGIQIIFSLKRATFSFLSSLVLYKIGASISRKLCYTEYISVWSEVSEYMHESNNYTLTLFHLFHLVSMCLSFTSIWFNVLNIIWRLRSQLNARQLYAFCRMSPWMAVLLWECTLFVCLWVFVPCSVRQQSSTVQQKRGSGASKIWYTRLLLNVRT